MRVIALAPMMFMSMFVFLLALGVGGYFWWASTQKEEEDENDDEKEDTKTDTPLLPPSSTLGGMTVTDPPAATDSERLEKFTFHANKAPSNPAYVRSNVAIPVGAGIGTCAYSCEADAYCQAFTVTKVQGSQSVRYTNCATYSDARLADVAETVTRENPPASVRKDTYVKKEIATPFFSYTQQEFVDRPLYEYRETGTTKRVDFYNPAFIYQVLDHDSLLQTYPVGTPFYFKNSAPTFHYVSTNLTRKLDLHDAANAWQTADYWTLLSENPVGKTFYFRRGDSGTVFSCSFSPWTDPATRVHSITISKLADVYGRNFTRLAVGDDLSPLTTNNQAAGGSGVNEITIVEPRTSPPTVFHMILNAGTARPRSLGPSTRSVSLSRVGPNGELIPIPADGDMAPLSRDAMDISILYPHMTGSVRLYPSMPGSTVLEVMTLAQPLVETCRAACSMQPTCSAFTYSGDSCTMLKGGSAPILRENGVGERSDNFIYKKN